MTDKSFTESDIAKGLGNTFTLAPHNWRNPSGWGKEAPYTEQERQILVRMYKQNKTLVQIGEALGRSWQSVQKRVRLEVKRECLERRKQQGGRFGRV